VIGVLLLKVKRLLVGRRLSTPPVSQESSLSLSQGSRCLSCQHGHDLEVLLPHLAAVVVDRIEPAGTLLCIRACARASSAVCPVCGRSSRRVHSRYERRLADAAIGGRRVVIRLQVRRLFCDDPGCAKTTFAEQVPGLTAGTRARLRCWSACCGTSR